MIVTSPPVYQRGISAVKAVHNGQITDGLRVAGLAAMANMIAGRRMKVHFRKCLPVCDIASIPTGPPRLQWYTRGRTSPNLKALRCRMLLAPASTAIATPNYEWTVNGVAQGKRGVAASAAAASSFGPSNLISHEFDLVDGSGDAIAGNTAFDAFINVDYGCRPVGATIFEIGRDKLDTATHVAVATDVWALGAEIYDRDVTDLTQAIWDLYKQQGTPHLAWARDASSATTQVGTTWKNAVDGATTGWATTAAGFYIWPLGRQRLTTTTVEVEFWVYASTAGGTTEVRVVGSGGTIATITGITTQGWYSATATLNASLADDLVIVEFRNATAGQTASLYSAVLHDYKP